MNLILVHQELFTGPTNINWDYSSYAEVSNEVHCAPGITQESQFGGEKSISESTFLYMYFSFKNDNAFLSLLGRAVVVPSQGSCQTVPVTWDSWGFLREEAIWRVHLPWALSIPVHSGWTGQGLDCTLCRQFSGLCVQQWVGRVWLILSWVIEWS